eukprot:scaffold929_cov387-Prasinococcus_capsulatus_cf.AAC.4
MSAWQRASGSSGREHDRPHPTLPTCVRRPQHLALLEARQRAQQRQLQALGQALAQRSRRSTRTAGRRSTHLHVELRRGAPFRLQEDLVTLLLREAHDLVLNGRAVARAASFYPAAVRRRLVCARSRAEHRVRENQARGRRPELRTQVVTDELVRGRGGAREVAAHLLATHVHALIEAEEAVLRLAWLFLQSAEVHRADVHAGGRARLQSDVNVRRPTVSSRPHPMQPRQQARRLSSRGDVSQRTGRSRSPALAGAP